MDLRAQRTLAAMHQSILTLAETEDIEGISVAHAAKAAGINRVTFYNHAESPAALLVSALQQELDPIRQRFLDVWNTPVAPDSTRESVSALGANASGVTILAVAEHIIARHAVYLRNLPPTGHGCLADFLTDHFAESARLMLSARSGIQKHLPGSTELPDTIRQNAAAQFIAQGAVGAIAVWTHGPTPLKPEHIATLVMDLMPAWWPTATQ